MNTEVNALPKVANEIHTAESLCDALRAIIPGLPPNGKMESLTLHVEAQKLPFMRVSMLPDKDANFFDDSHIKQFTLVPAEVGFEVPTHSQGIVAEFHRKFGHPVEDKPTVPTRKNRLLRVALIAEELGELAHASGVPFEYKLGKLGDVTDEVDMVEVADALGDIEYVTSGAYCVYGLPGYKIVQHIHDSNMSKLGADGKPVLDEAGKVVKGPNYWKPDIANIIGNEVEWREIKPITK